MEEEPLYVRTFGEAVSAAFGLHDRFGRAHAAIITDADGLLLDLTVFVEPEHDAAAAMRWAYAVVDGDERARRIVLVSAVGGDVRELSNGDVENLERAREDFEELGAEVLDWIQFDGEWTRSLALSIGWDTWDGDEDLARLLAIHN